VLETEYVTSGEQKKVTGTCAVDSICIFYLQASPEDKGPLSRAVKVKALPLSNDQYLRCISCISHARYYTSSMNASVCLSSR
jgi:hypothetical protein